MCSAMLSDVHCHTCCAAQPDSWLVPCCCSQLILSAAGKNFCAGLDLSYLTNTFGAKMQDSSCPARLRAGFRQDILQMQVWNRLAGMNPFTGLQPQHIPAVQLILQPTAVLVHTRQCSDPAGRKLLLSASCSSAECSCTCAHTRYAACACLLVPAAAQEAFSVLEQCRFPVIAAVQGGQSPDSWSTH